MIGLRLIDESHDGQNVDDHVAYVLADYGLSEKMFSITLDNASALDKLEPILSRYLNVSELFCISIVLVTLSILSLRRTYMMLSL